MVIGVKGETEFNPNCITITNNDIIGTTEGTHVHWAFIINKIKGCHNATQNSILSYHNGNTDTKCQHQGHHLHWIADLKVHPTRDARWGRGLQEYCRQFPGVTYFASQYAKDACALGRYVAKPPRQVLIAKGDMLLSASPPMEPSTSTSSTTEETKVDPKAKVMKNTRYHRVNLITQLMKKYRSSEITSLRNLVSDNIDDWQIWKEMSANADFEQLCGKAMSNFNTERNKMTLPAMMGEYSAWAYNNEDKGKYLSLPKSLQLFDRWILEQGFIKEEFLNDLFNVLQCNEPKLNTFVLQGEPNSGKSLILRSLAPIFMTYGEPRSDASYAFAWMDCIDKKLILWEEPLITDKSIEQLKLVLEGADTYVHVKNKCDAMLRRTPVLITTNSPLWKWVNSERNAISARCHIRY